MGMDNELIKILKQLEGEGEDDEEKDAQGKPLVKGSRSKESEEASNRQQLNLEELAFSQAELQRGFFDDFVGGWAL